MYTSVKNAECLHATVLEKMLTDIHSMPTIVTTATVKSFPRNSTKSPSEFIAAKLTALDRMTLYACRAALQKPHPWMAGEETISVSLDISNLIKQKHILR